MMAKKDAVIESISSDKIEALKGDNQKLRWILESIGEGVVVADSNGNIVFMNRVAEQILGKRGLNVKVEARPNHFGIYHADTHKMFQPEELPLTLAMQGRETHDLEVFIKNENTAGSYILVNGRPLKNEEGEVTGGLVIIKDITEKKSTELLLAQSKEMYRAVVEEQTECICRFQPGGTITFVNEAYARYFDSKVENLLGTNVFNTFPEEKREKFQKNIGKLTISCPIFEQKWRYTNPDGKERWQYWTNRALFNVRGEVEEYQSVGRDITDLENAQKALDAQRNFLRNVIDTNPNIIYVRDGEGNFILANKSFSKLLDKEISDIEGKNARDVVENEWIIDQSLMLDEEALKSKSTVIIPEEIVVNEETGEVKWYNTIKSPIQSTNGDDYQVLTISSEITGRIRAENTLKFQLELEDLLSKLSKDFINISIERIDKAIEKGLESIASFLNMDIASIAVIADDKVKGAYDFVSDKSKVIRRGNFPMDLQVFTRSRAHIEEEGMFYVPSVEKLDEKQYAPEKKIYRQVGLKSLVAIPIFSKNSNIGFFTLASSREEREWSSESLSLFVMASQIFANAIERKQTEESLHENEKLYRTLAGNIPNSAVILFDHNLSYKLLDGAMLGSLGFDKERHEGRQIREVAAEVELDFKESRYTDALAGKETVLEKEYSGKHYLIHFLPVKNDLNEIFSGMIMAIDVTDMKKAQRELEAQADELMRSNSDLEMFAYAASHDMQEPLRMVSSYVNLIQKKIGKDQPKDVNDFMNFAIDGVQRMQELINDLLEYSRVERKGDSFNEIATKSLIGLIERNLQTMLHEKGASIECDNLPLIKADQSQILRLFQNLIDNGIKFNDSPHPVVKISCTELFHEWQFEVSDNGIGIDERYYEKIFVIFQRLNSRKAYSGTGIGLAICKKIVERHGGTIWVNSLKGKGTTFYFTLKKAQ